jgi:FtsH-binding integral membrane protein
MSNQQYPETYHAIGIPVNEIPIIKPTESWYVFKVLNIVFVQLLVTIGMAVTAYYNKTVLINYIEKDKGIIVLPIVFSLGSLIAISCCKPIKSIAYLLFVIFTLSMAAMIAIAILPYSPQILIIATTATAVTVFAINSVALYCAMKNIDFTYLGPGLFGALCGILVLTILQYFIHSTIMAMFISIFGILIFSTYLLYDLNRLYNRDDYEDDPILAAINIYLDIINLFLYILQFLQLTGNND